MSNKFLISYLGGSGGDFFCNSCNGIYIKNINLAVKNKITLKKIENKKNKFKILSTLNKTNYQFINTHLFQEILNNNIPVISLIFRKNNVMEKIILRQMQIQHLTIKINKEEYILNLIRKLCFNKEYNKAAKLYFEFSKNLWLEKHQSRVLHKNKIFKTLYFDELFSNNFCESLKNQQWNVNLEILKINHIHWLKKNNIHNFTYNNTIDSMSYKFSQMPWNVEEGYIKYVPQ